MCGSVGKELRLGYRVGRDIEVSLFLDFGFGFAIRILFVGRLRWD
jgi:hypothetical protein